MKAHRQRIRRLASIAGVAWIAFAGSAALAQPSAGRQLDEATELLVAFTNGSPESIPAELIERARGIAVIPRVFRGGFILGARRGRGVLSIRMADGSWSNPAFVTLTGGSIGWQIGAESTDIVLVFANDNAVKNISTGKFTLGGEASAVAGPLRRQASSTMTFRAEVYGYLRSRGLYAGAAFQGARLNIDEEFGAAIYLDAGSARPLGQQNALTPAIALPFLQALGNASDSASGSQSIPSERGIPEVETFPLPD